MKFGDIGNMVVLTLREPGRAVALMRDMALPMPSRWMVLLLAVSLSTLLAGVARVMFPLPGDDPLAPLLSSPFTLALAQLGALVLSAALVTAIGRSFGGHGSFADALLLIGWVELILVGLQAMQLVVMAVLPGSGALMSMMAFALSIYLTISLTKALHGFQNTAKVALAFLGSAFALGFVLSILAAAFGILPEVTP